MAKDKDKGRKQVVNEAGKRLEIECEEPSVWATVKNRDCHA